MREDRSDRPRPTPAVGGEVVVAEPPALGAANHRAHLVGGVEVPCVVPALELCNVTVKVLGAHAVKHADVGPLEHRPEALDPVGGDPAPRELARFRGSRSRGS